MAETVVNLENHGEMSCKVVNVHDSVVFNDGGFKTTVKSNISATEAYEITLPASAGRLIIDSELTALESTVASNFINFENAMSGNTADIDSNSGRINDLTSVVNANKTELDTSIADQATQIADHESRIVVNEQKLANHNTGINNQDNKLNEHEAKLTDHEARLVSQKAEIESNDADIATAAANVANMETNLREYIDSQDHTVEASEVSALELSEVKLVGGYKFIVVDGSLELQKEGTVVAKFTGTVAPAPAEETVASSDTIELANYYIRHFSPSDAPFDEEYTDAITSLGNYAPVKLPDDYVTSTDFEAIRTAIYENSQDLAHFDNSKQSFVLFVCETGYIPVNVKDMSVPMTTVSNTFINSSALSYWNSEEARNSNTIFVLGK